MPEVNAEESDISLISLLDKAAQDNEIIIRRQGKRIAGLISEDKKNETFLPSLAGFRASVKRLCKSFYRQTVCKTVLQKIRKARIMTAEKIS